MVSTQQNVNGSAEEVGSVTSGSMVIILAIQTGINMHGVPMLLCTMRILNLDFPKDSQALLGISRQTKV